LEIYLQREGDPEAAVALSVLLIGIAAVVVVGLGGRRIAGWGAG
jgi:molybdate transport system permease protein